MTVNLLSVQPGDIVILRDLSVNTVKHAKPVKLAKVVREKSQVIKLVFAETGRGYEYTKDGLFFSGAENDVDVIDIVYAKGEGAEE